MSSTSSLRQRARDAVERKTGRKVAGDGSGAARGVTRDGYPLGRITVGAIWRFGRPHTLIGTSISIISVTLCALDELNDFTQPHILFAVAVALVTALLMNIFIVGLNQMTDIAIDKINKPQLPVASGELTVQQGWGLVFGSLIGSLGGGFAFGTDALTYTLFGSMVLGIIYSCEPFRLKRYPALAAFCILAVRGFIVQFGFLHHVYDTETAAGLRGRAWQYPVRVLFASAFMTVFSVVIALFKDLPDVEGDKTHGVRTLSVRMGIATVFRVCVTLLAVDYVLAAYMGFAVSTQDWSMYLTVGVHLLLLAAALFKASGVNPKSHRQITRYYMFVWKVFYIEYLFLPFLLR